MRPPIWTTLGPKNPVLDSTASAINEDEARNLALSIIYHIDDYVRRRDLTMRQAFSALVRSTTILAIELRIDIRVWSEEIVRGATAYVRNTKAALKEDKKNDLPC
jgi:hypothetical protein